MIVQTNGADLTPVAAYGEGGDWQGGNKYGGWSYGIHTQADPNPPAPAPAPKARASAGIVATTAPATVSGSQAPVWPWLLGGGLLASAVGLAFYVVRRRRHG